MKCWGLLFFVYFVFCFFSFRDYFGGDRYEGSYGNYVRNVGVRNRECECVLFFEGRYMLGNRGRGRNFSIFRD